MNISSLQNKIYKGNITFFVGAGISADAPSNLPLAGEIIGDIVNALLDLTLLTDKEREEVFQASGSIRFEVMLDLLFRDMGESVFEVFKLLGTGSPNSIHHFLAKALELDNNVVTTNFDVKIEQAVQHKNKVQTIKSNSAFSTFARKKKTPSSCLFKLHGSLREDESLPKKTSLIAAVQQVGLGLQASKGVVIEKLFAEQTVIVLGYSGRDEFDIIPKLTSLQNIKEILWVVHEDWAFRETGKIDGYLEQLFKKLGSQTRYVVANTAEFVSELGQVTSKPTSNDEHLQQRETRRKKIQSLLLRNIRSTLMLIGDICEYGGNTELARICFRKGSLQKESNSLSWLHCEYKHANIERLTGNLTLSQDIAVINLENAQEVGNKNYIARAYNLLGILARKSARWQEALDMYKKGLKALEKVKNDELTNSLNNNIGIVFDKLGKFDKALESYKKSIEYDRKQGDIEGVSTTLNNIGIVNDNTGNYEEAVKYYQESIELKKQLGYHYGIGQTTNNLGLVYEHQEDWDNALKWYERSLEIKQKISRDLHGVAQTRMNIGHIYYRKKLFAKALYLMEEALSYLLKQKDMFGISEGYEYIAKVYIALKRYTDAKDCLLKSIAIAQANNLDFRIESSSKLLNKLTDFD